MANARKPSPRHRRRPEQPASNPVAILDPNVPFSTSTPYWASYFHEAVQALDKLTCLWRDAFGRVI
jgi:hypothetical protein